MTDVYTTALLLTKPSSDDDSGFRHGFRAEASLPLTQSTSAVTHDTTRLCWIDVTLRLPYPHWFSSSLILDLFLLSDGKIPRLVKNMEVELVMKPLHPTLIGNTLVIQPISDTLFLYIFIFFIYIYIIFIYMYIIYDVIYIILYMMYMILSRGLPLRGEK